MQVLVELAMTKAAATLINFVDADEFTSMLVRRLSGANILHARESIDTTAPESSTDGV